MIVGLVLRWHSGRRLLAEQEKELLRASVVESRRELARQLHDTTAKDLAHVAVLAQDIAIRHPELNEEMDPLVSAATSASRRIRPMILAIDTSATEPTLPDVIEQVTRMLKTRNITLDLMACEDLDRLLSHQQRRTAALAIRECCSNILEYAPSDSLATLVAERNDTNGLLTISLSNEIAAQPAAPALSSGYGLENLGGRIQNEGGTMDITNAGGQWLTVINLPVDTPQPQHEGT
ncbi:hypothetical protein O6R08_07230 [Cutibacterium equinum]|uniref:Signal transduction histidine kinase subgroup 3 dimerisation and phosphoacceptor domain-containing protein n=1 Tax=Cutibacterium equinum TaxID=3016342 RepID=A0ABY7QW83_9ACTN|nr:hypothetical protein [Cutibacterium equinum]WCC79328.1 hypothetical protein O6R08_07230 [Cutibacterium equinum]